MSSLRLLLIEDNPADVRLLREALIESGDQSIILRHCDSLAMAMKSMESEPVDLVLLDLSLPDSRGLVGVERLQNAGISAPIVVLSGLSDEATAVEAVRLGAQDYLVKGQVSGPLLVRAARYAIERARLQEELRVRLLSDPLTGLPSRALLSERLLHAIRLAERRKQQLALLYLDLDGFKQVNDQQGHDAGDFVLKETAQRLRTCLRLSDTVARLGGDEFIVLVDSVTNPAYVATVAEKIIDAVGHPIPIGSALAHVTASVGISTFPDDGLDAGSLMKSSDAAMYRAKQLGKNRYQFFSVDLHRDSQRRHEIGEQLKLALARAEFELHYQPRIAQSDGTWCGIEAFLRWRDAHGQIHTPAEFLDVAEGARAILPIGAWVLRHALAQARRWQELGLAIRPIAINLSVTEASHPALLSDVQNALADSGLNPADVEIQVTERCLSRSDSVSVVFSRLAKIGVKLALDEYGLGGASLAQLAELGVSRLILARDTIAALPEKNARAVVLAAVGVARALDLRLTAPNVESAAQAAWLKQAGCHELQGEFLVAPLSAAELEAVALART